MFRKVGLLVKTEKAFLSQRDEQERVQKKTFTNWINSYLLKVDPSLKVNDLFIDIKDGIKLLQLLEVLSGIKLPTENKRVMQRVHHLSNLRTALEFLEKRKVKLVNINPADIADGKPSIVLGLIWTIILHFQIEEQEQLIKQQEGETKKTTAKEALLTWTGKAVTVEKYGIEVKDFGPSWRDGRAFSAMVHSINPDLLDMEQVGEDHRENLENVFNIAETHLGIPKLLDAEDVDVDKPDEKSIMTYVMQFLKAFPDASSENAETKKSYTPEERERLELEAIKKFLNTPSEEVPTSDIIAEYQAFASLEQEYRNLKPAFKHLVTASQSNQLLSIQASDLDPVIVQWNEVEELLDSWRWKLDAALPLDLNPVGAWLIRAEKCLYQEWPTGSDQQISDALRQRLKEHKTVFKDMPGVIYRYKTVIEDNMIRKGMEAQLKALDRRLERIAKDEPVTLRKMECYELRHQILHHLFLCGEKIRLWSPKYGLQEAVEKTMADYKNFVENANLFETLDQAMEDYQTKAAKHVSQDLSGNTDEAGRMNSFSKSSVEEWDAKAKDIRQTQTQLRDVLDRWKMYNQIFGQFTDWLPKAEKALTLSSDERASFFSYLQTWTDLHRTLNKNGSELQDQCLEDVVVKIKVQLEEINTRWEQLFQKTQQILEADKVEKQTREFSIGFQKITTWLETTDNLMTSPTPCIFAEMEIRFGKLEAANEELKDTQIEFQNISKEAQAIGATTWATSTTPKMMEELETTQFRLTRISTDLPKFVEQFRRLLALVEACEASLTEVEGWLEETEHLLKEHKVQDGNPEQRKTLHQAQFEKETRIRSFMATVRKEAEKVHDSKVDCLQLTPLENRMLDATKRLESTTLENKKWRTIFDFTIKEITLKEKLKEAEIKLEEEEKAMEKEGNYDAIVVSHNKYFVDGDFHPRCKEVLSELQSLVEVLQKANPNDNEFKTRRSTSQMEYDDICQRADLLFTQMQDIPVKMEACKTKLQKMKVWMDEVQELSQLLKRDDLPADEYKKALARFQELTKDFKPESEESRELVALLQELKATGPKEETEAYQSMLNGLLQTYESLAPVVKETKDKAPVVAKCLDYKEKIIQDQKAIEETKDSMTKQPPPDDLETVLQLLAEQESLMKRLGSKKDMVDGKNCGYDDLDDGDIVEALITPSTQSLQLSWNSANDSARQRFDELKETARCWEEYEADKDKLRELLHDSEGLLKSSRPVTGQEAIKKDLQAKEELLNSLKDVRPVLEQMKANALKLRAKASPERQAEIDKEIEEIEKQMQEVDEQIQANVGSLQRANKQWEDLNEDMDEFTKLNKTIEDKMARLNDPDLTPEERIKLTDEIAADMEKADGMLRKLQESGADITEMSPRGKESANIKTKLTQFSRQMSQISKIVKEEKQNASEAQLQLDTFHELLKTLEGYLEEADVYLKSELPKYGSIDDITNICASHDDFETKLHGHQDTFLKLQELADSLPTQTKVQEAFESISQIWENSNVRSSQRRQNLDLLRKKFETYEFDVEELLAVLKSEENELVELEKLPDSSNQLAECKSLQDKLKAHEKKLFLLGQKLSDMRPNLTQDGQTNLTKTKQDAQDMLNSLSKAVLNKLNLLNHLIEEKNSLYKKMDEINRWLGKTDGLLGKSDDIYSDEVIDASTQLQTLLEKFNYRKEQFGVMSTEFQDLCDGLMEIEVDELRKRYTEVSSRFYRASEKTEFRCMLCERWLTVDKSRKEWLKRLNTAQDLVDSPGFSVDEIPQVQSELLGLKEMVPGLEKEAEAVDKLMKRAKMTIKERDDDFSFKSSVQKVSEMCDKFLEKIKRKEEQLKRVDEDWKFFNDMNEDLLQSIHELESQISSASLTSLNKEKLSELQDTLGKLQTKLTSKQSQVNELKELSTRLGNSDPSKATAAQELFNGVETAWNHANSLLEGKQQCLSNVATLNNDMNSSLETINSISDSLSQTAEQKTKPTSPDEIHQLLEDIEYAEQELLVERKLLDNLQSKAQQLKKEGQQFPGFDKDNVDGEVNSANQRMTAIKKALDEKKQALTTQLACWEHIKQVDEDLESWLDGTVKKLEQTAEETGDAFAAKSKLDSYKSEAAYYDEARNVMARRISELKHLNQDNPNPELDAKLEAFETKFATAKQYARRLSTQMHQFSDEKEGIREEMKGLSEELNTLRDSLSRYDDQSGTDEEIIDRIEAVKDVRSKLQSMAPNMEDLYGRVKELAEKFPSAETSALQKEIELIMKKAQNFELRTETTEASLEKTLDHNLEKAQTAQQAWIAAAVEKIQWAESLTGDKDSMESKLAALNELLSTLDEGEQQTEEVAEKMILGKRVRPQHAGLPSDHEDVRAKFRDLVDDINKTKALVETTAAKLEDFATLEGEVEDFVKKGDIQLKQYRSPVGDLSDKEKQLEDLKALEKSVREERDKIAKLREEGHGIAETTGDAKTKERSLEMERKYDQLAKQLADQLAKVEAGVDEHRDYKEKNAEGTAWLDQAKTDLAQCQGLPEGDKNSVRAKLELVKKLLSDKEKGQTNISSTVQAGERLYPTTSSEGRDVIRGELRVLRDGFDTYTDELVELQRQLESDMAGWSSYDESFEKLMTWMDDVEGSVAGDTQLKNSLPEKRNMLQLCRNRLQDIMAHETMMESVADKGYMLNSQEIKEKLSQAKVRFGALADRAKKNLKTSEDYVEQHQSYLDALQVGADWLQSAKKRLEGCEHDISDGAADKHTLQTKLDKLEALCQSVKEGEEKARTLSILSEVVLPQTASEGKTLLEKKTTWLTTNLAELKDKIDQVKEGHEDKLAHLHEYDNAYESLFQWFKDTEPKLKDQDTKGTLESKEEQLGSLQALLSSIDSKKEEFIDFEKQLEALETIDPKLANKGRQFCKRYEGLRNDAENGIEKWTNVVEEHCQYEKRASLCSSRIAELNAELESCYDTSGTPEEVRKRQAKIQSILNELETCTQEYQDVLDSGERLYPVTSGEGRDQIRNELQQHKERLDKLNEKAEEANKAMETNLETHKAFDHTADDLSSWLTETEAKLQEAEILDPTVQDKRNKLRSLKKLQQEIASHELVLQSLNEKVQQISDPEARAKAEELQRHFSDLLKNSQSKLQEKESALQDHQAYTEEVDNFKQWKADMKDRLEGSCEPTGDKSSLQAKLNKLQDFTDALKEGESKLEKITARNQAAAATVPPEQRKAMEEEEATLRRELDQLRQSAGQASGEIQDAVNCVETFEEEHGLFGEWLKQVEGSLKELDPKATAEEKKAYLEKLQKLISEVEQKGTVLNALAATSDNVVKISDDTRLEQEMAQIRQRYNKLKNQAHEKSSKLTKAVEDHTGYDMHLEEFQKSLENTEHQITALKAKPLRSQADVESRLAEINKLRNDESKTAQKYEATQKASGRVFGETSSQGREKIRNDLRLGKDALDSVVEELDAYQEECQKLLGNLSSFSDTKEQLTHWLDKSDERLAKTPELNYYEDTKAYVADLKSMQHDINVHQRMLDDALQKAQSLKETENAKEPIEASTRELTDRYEAIKSKAQESLSKADKIATIQAKYQTSLQSANDWVTLAKDRLDTTSDLTGDKFIMQGKLDRLKQLSENRTEGEALLDNLKEASTKANEVCGFPGRQRISAEVAAATAAWETYDSSMNDVQRRLENRIKDLEECDKLRETISVWMKERETKVRSFGLKSTLEEKKMMLNDFRELDADIESHSKEVDDTVTKIAETLVTDIMEGDIDVKELRRKTTTAAGRTDSHVDQLNARYHALLTSAKDIVRRCELITDNHQEYINHVKDFTRWLEKAKTLRQKLNGCNDIEEMRRLVGELNGMRDEGFDKLNCTLDAGERLNPNTAPEGREMMREELYHLKADWDAIYDNLSSVEHEVEQSLDILASAEETKASMEEWLHENEGHFEVDTLVLRDTLEEKRQQYQFYKSKLHEIESHWRAAVSMANRMIGMAESGENRHLRDEVDKLTKRFHDAVTGGRTMVQRYDEIVRDHQQFDEQLGETKGWLHSLADRFSGCHSLKGDRHAVQGRLDRVMDVSSLKPECDSKVEQAKERANKTCENTAPKGKEVVRKVLNDLDDEWKSLVSSINGAKDDLQVCLKRWNDYEKRYSEAMTLMKESEAKVRSIELCSKLAEKKSQVKELDEIMNLETAKENEFKEILEEAESLAAASGEKDVARLATQLCNRNEAFIRNLKDLSPRWSQWADDHEKYMESFEGCSKWMKEFETKLKQCSGQDNKRSSLEAKISTVHELIEMREDGFKQVEEIAISMQKVLPNTAGPGRTKIREEVEDLQETWDTCLSLLTTTKQKLDATYAYWTLYYENEQHLLKWLAESENQLEGDKVLQATLQEKNVQLESLKSLHMSLGSHESDINHLTSKAKELSELTSCDDAIMTARYLSNRYEELCGATDKAIETTEQYVKEHENYRNICDEVNEQIMAVQTKIKAQNEDKGDLETIEMHLSTVQDLEGEQKDVEDKLHDVIEAAEIANQGSNAYGKEILKSEIKQLETDSRNLRSDVRNHKQNLTDLRTQWLQFEENYDQLSGWLQDTEKSLKSNAQCQTTIDEKKAILLRHKPLHESILSKKECFNDLSESAEILMQDSSALKVKTRLSQLTARYQSLTSQSSDILKKLKQNVDDHTTYQNQYVETETWLDKALAQLKRCRETPSDRYAAQAQLDKLNDLFATKDEGQILLQNTSSWADKTMASTSDEGRGVIKDEMAKLISSLRALDDIGLARSELESVLVSLTEYDDNLAQIERWISHTEARITEDGLKGDLSEKMVRLQKARGLNSEIASYKSVIETVIRKMEGRPAVDSSAEREREIWDRYHVLVDAGKEFYKECESHVAKHQEYQNVYLNFDEWMRKEREKLSSCCDTYGMMNIIEEKLELSKVLSSDLSKGSDKLRRLGELVDELTDSTSSSGQIKLQNEVQHLRDDIDDYKLQVNEVHNSLRKCLDMWDEFEKSKQQLEDWLSGAESFLRQEIDKKSTLEQKIHDQEVYRENHEDILAHQNYLEAMKEKANQLLEMNADSHIMHDITHISTRYHDLINLSNDIGRRLDSYVNEHTSFNHICDEIQEFCLSTEGRISELKNAASSKSAFEEILSKLNQIEIDIESAGQKLRLSQECACKTIVHTDRRGGQIIEDELDKMRQKFRELKDMLVKKRKKIEQSSAILQDCERSCGHLLQWLQDAEGRLTDDPLMLVDLGERKAALECLRILLLDADNKKPVLEKLRHQADEVDDVDINNTLEDISERFNNVIVKASDLFARLEESVSAHEQYRRSLEAANEWLTQSKMALLRLNDPGGGIGDLEERMNQTKSFKVDVQRKGEATVAAVLRDSDHALKISPLNRETILGEVGAIQEQFASHLEDVTNAEMEFDRLVELWRLFTANCSESDAWIRKMEDKLKGSVGPIADRESRIRKVEKFRALYSEIESRKADIEELQSEGNELHEATHDPYLTSKITQFSSRYQALLNKCKGCIQSMNKGVEQAALDHKAYEESIESLRTWIEATTQKLMLCADFNGDQQAVQDKMEVCREIIVTMETGQLKLDKAFESGDRVILQATPEGGDHVRRELEDLQINWNELNRQISQVTGTLERASSKWTQYGKLLSRLGTWLNGVENSMGQMSLRDEDLLQKKAQFEKFKTLKHEAELIEPEFVVLNEVSGELYDACKKESIADENALYRKRFEHIKGKILGMIAAHTAAHARFVRYQDTLHDCERWILAASFRIMSTSTTALDSPSMESATGAAERHRSFMTEISDFRGNVDQVVALGSQLMEKNKQSEETGDQIKTQVANLMDSYANLQSTAEQIKERLQDNLAKWLKFMRALDRGEEFLHGELSSWWLDKEIPRAMSTDDVSKQVADTKTMQSKIQFHRQEVGTCAYRCDLATCLSDRPPSRSGSSMLVPTPPPMPSPRQRGSPGAFAHRPVTLVASPFIPGLLRNGLEPGYGGPNDVQRRIEKFEGEANEAMIKLDKRIRDLHELKVQWDKWAYNRDDLRDWLRQKENEVTDVTICPSKGQDPAAEEDLLKIKELRNELLSMESSIIELRERYDNMTANQGKDLIMTEMQNHYTNLLDHLNNHIARRASELHGKDDFTPKRETTGRVRSGLFTEEYHQLPLASPTQPERFTVETLNRTRPYHDAVPDSLRNSGGNRGISKKFWPYNEAYQEVRPATSDDISASDLQRSLEKVWTPERRGDVDENDPIETLRLALKNMEQNSTGSQTTRDKITQTAAKTGKQYQELRSDEVDESDESEEGRVDKMGPLKLTIPPVRDTSHAKGYTMDSSDRDLSPVVFQLQPSLSSQLNRTPFSTPRTPAMESIRRSGCSERNSRSPMKAVYKPFDDSTSPDLNTSQEFAASNGQEKSPTLKRKVTRPKSPKRSKSPLPSASTRRPTPTGAAASPTSLNNSFHQWSKSVSFTNRSSRRPQSATPPQSPSPRKRPTKPGREPMKSNGNSPPSPRKREIAEELDLAEQPTLFRRPTYDLVMKEFLIDLDEMSQTAPSARKHRRAPSGCSAGEGNRDKMMESVDSLAASKSSLFQ